MFLTQSGGFIMKPISKLLGVILSLLYDGLNSLGIINIGLAIILFTLIIRLILLPLMIKQNRASKIMNYIQPEINKVTKKYKGKKDQESLMAQQRETREIQDKYGASMTGGCLTSIIQLPIFFGLYRVIQNIPAYVDKIKALYEPIATQIVGNQDAMDKLREFKNNGGNNTLKSITLTDGNVNTVIDVLAKFSENSWDSFKALFDNQGAIVDSINANVPKINEIYTLFGINLTSAPGFALTAALIIPILSMIFQFLSMHVVPQQESTDPTQQATMKTMKMMMNVMPIMSFFVCVGVPAGVGLYWATGAFMSFITSVLINIYFKHCNMDKIIEKSMAKAAKKKEKREKSGKKTFMEKMQEAAYGPQESNPKVNSNAAKASLKGYSSSTMRTNDENVKYRPGSLAAKANILQNYNKDNK